jgi:hypothetical protein
VPFIGAEGEGGDRMMRRWWWPSGAINPTVSALIEGGDEGKGKRQGWRPLRGGEGVDGEAARRGGTPTLGRKVVAAAC